MIADILNSGFEGIPISYSPRTDDVIALTLLACFFLSSIALARGKKFLTQQVKDFVLHRERTSIFDSSTAADVRYLLVLVVQTCVLTGIVFFNYFHDTCPMLMTKVSPLLLLGIYVGFCLAYFLLKWLLYMFLGWVFFDKNKTNIWLESYYAHILRRIRPFSFCSIPCLFRSEPDQFSDNRTNYSNFY